MIAAISCGALDLSPVVTDVIDWHEYARAFDLASDPSTSSKVLLAIDCLERVL